MRTLKRTLAPLEEILIIQFLYLATRYFFKQNKQTIYPKLSKIIKSLFELASNKFKIVRKDNSFANEFQVIERTLNIIGHHNRYLVDIGASDGITQSSTSKLLIHHNYSASLFEYHSENFSKLAFLYNSRSDINLVKTRLTPNNIVSLMKGLGVPQTFSFLNIDIDSYDLEILRSLLMSGYMPQLISMEINEIFPPNIEFEVLFSDTQSWQGDHFFGCSVASANKALSQLGYKLVEIEYNNAFFINDTVATKFEFNRNVFDLYKQGYQNKPDRTLKFPGNLDVEFLLDSNTQEATQKINRLFKKYEGKFLLNIANLNI
jgi:hypothetical protein